MKRMRRIEDVTATINEIADLKAVIGLLGWDEETYAPPKGRAARGQHTATLEGLNHRLLVDKKFGDDLEACLQEELTPTQRVMVERAQRERNRAVKVPEKLVRDLAAARSKALETWQAARKEDHFATFAPDLGKIVELTRERADALKEGDGDAAAYDALLDEYEPGAKSAELDTLFNQLRPELVRVLDAVREPCAAIDRSFLQRSFDPDEQWKFTMRLLEDLGFDFERGRQDKSTHPFSGGPGGDDVRLTTRVVENDPLNAIFSSIHECGHGLYEQGFDPAHHRTPLAAGASMGLHESQSRLWENQIGRSAQFWQHYFPILKHQFPTPLVDIEVGDFVKAINTVQPSFIRTESDEVTYNLHIIVRFQIERALLSGDLKVDDLPQAWNERMRDDLGVVVPNNAQGCLQDIHWAFGAFGYFPTYTLGNLYSAQLAAAYEQEHPDVWQDVSEGRFAPLLNWLRAKVHRRGFSAYCDEIVKDATGQSLDIKPFVGYLEKKFGGLFDVKI